jgi:CRISPR-associated endonuclease/helicase Cas3
LAALSELVLNYRSTVVLATATQPALASRPAEGFDGMPDLVELCPDVDGVFQALGRVAVRHAGYLSDPDLERTILASPRILVIVNTKRHARELFERVRDLPHAYHLSTSMCGAHRSAVIAEIKARLRAGLPCVVVSTPLIEAGVNVDFPVVMRAEAGIDSVAQASGRCNREGLLDGMGEVVLFSVGKRHTLKCTASEVDVARGIVDRMAAGTLCGTLLDPSTVTEYFCDLYWTRGPDGLDEGGILALIEAGLSDLNFPYETIDDLFRMIDEEGTPVVVMEPTAADALSILGAEPSALDVSRAVRRHSVNVRSKDLGAMIDGGHIRFISEERFGRQFPTLASSELYDARIGFNIV